MILDNSSVDQAFCQALGTVSKEFQKQDTPTSFFLQFFEKESKLFFFAKGDKPHPVPFSKLIGAKMIGLGVTVEKIYMALHWLKSVCQINLSINETSDLSFLLFPTEKSKFALIGVCLNGKHLISYRLAEVLAQFDSKQEHLN